MEDYLAKESTLRSAYDTNYGKTAFTILFLRVVVCYADLAQRYLLRNLFSGKMTVAGFQHVEDQNDNYLAPSVEEINEMNEEAKKVQAHVGFIGHTY